MNGPEDPRCRLSNSNGGPPLKSARWMSIDISPMPAASWPNACATLAPAGKRTALASQTLINFIVAADVSRLKILTGWNNERTDVRCYGIYAMEPEAHPPCP